MHPPNFSCCDEGDQIVVRALNAAGVKLFSDEPMEGRRWLG